MNNINEIKEKVHQSFGLHDSVGMLIDEIVTALKSTCVEDGLNVKDVIRYLETERKGLISAVIEYHPDHFELE